MSPAFQETISGNPLLLQAQNIHFTDTITIQHKTTQAWLHSHPEYYPLKYDDGRVSSQGQQVTGYPHNDSNNHWRIERHARVATVPLDELKSVIQHHDVVRLFHVGTQSYLLTHDVASPLTPTNTEFTTISPVNSEEKYEAAYNNTLFHLDFIDGHGDFKSKRTYFRLAHVPLNVALSAHDTPLPDWGSRQLEVNGHKTPTDNSATWFVDSIVHSEINDSPNAEPAPENNTAVKKAKHRNFFLKYFELQRLMLSHNSGLTSSHPYESRPLEWPFLITGISFWTKTEGQHQIYFIGNVLSWLPCVAAMAMFAGLYIAEQLARRRGIQPLDACQFNTISHI